MEKGKLIVFEGIDGCGKDTQIELLKRKLVSMHYDTVIVRNITTGSIGKAIREILCDSSMYLNNHQVGCLFAAELHNVVSDIKGLLNSGLNVICNRYYFSTLAYATNNHSEFMDILGICKFEIEPDILIYLDLDPEIAMERISKSRDKLDGYEEINWLTHIKKRYDVALKVVKPTTKLYRIDANRPVSEVYTDILYSTLNNLE